MEIIPLPYDAVALERFAREGPFIWFWEPQRTEAVLGAGTPETDVNLALCAAAGVPVYRRKGGGGAVVLTPGCLVITAAYDARRKAFATQWIGPIAEAVALALTRLGLRDVSVRGMGDVAIGDLKVLGSSLYANREVALYQGSLLVDPDLEEICALLPHPSREPDYRRGRSHAAFMTSLAREGYRGGRQELERALAEELRRV
ncbi:lipoate--protein ligase family protein [Symbiobacterium terraclitae]|uniref:lipoate--protein ligase family protein n=1 Tax=Symbiobacterium terraclitae TaxID=557451 RepID=UPI0035B52DA1